jgi:hypothetical protein
MTLRTYNGALKKRSDLEDIFQERLPRKAKVLFATLKHTSVPMEYGPPAQQDSVLAFWEFNRIFIGVHAVRRWIPNEVTGALQTSPWMIQDEKRIDAKSALEGMHDERVKWPDAWLPLKDALREVFAKMVAMEEAWGIDPVAAQEVLASERFAARRN